jgi:hypothetical protein
MTGTLDLVVSEDNFEEYEDFLHRSRLTISTA